MLFSFLALIIKVKDDPVFPANLQCLQKMINNIPERSHVGAEFLKISEDLKSIRDKKILPLESLNDILQLRIAPLTKALEKLTKMASCYKIYHSH